MTAVRRRIPVPFFHEIDPRSTPVPNPTPAARTRRTARTAALAAAVTAVLVCAPALPAHADDAQPASPVPPAATTAPEPSPADEAPAYEDEAPAPDPATTEESAPSARTAMLAQRSVPAAATGFKLQYAFEPGVQPSTVELLFDGAPGARAAEQSYDWSDGGVHYLQWDFPMPQDSAHTVTLRAGLIDHGHGTEYEVEYTSVAQRTAGSLAVRTECAILWRGAPIDLDDDSPFACEGASGQTASGALLIGAQTALRPWADITGTIDVRNTGGAGPRISLRDGVFTTANQDHRIIMNGEEWYPFDDRSEPATGTRFATIANGSSLTWSASALNSPRKQSEPDTHAQAMFAYEILLDDAPTGYWVRGSAENYKSGALWYPSATCEIYIGDPEGDDGRSTPVTGATPFTCETTGMTKPNARSAADTVFQVRMAPADTLRSASLATQRGVREACAPGGDACVTTIGTVRRVTKDPIVPRPSDPAQSTSFTNDAGHTAQYAFDFSFHRDVTHSLEQTLGLELKAEILPGIESKVTSETAYGYDVEKGFDVGQSAEEEVPFWSTGAFYYTDVYDEYSSDLYFIGEGGTWYRVTGATIEVPVAQQLPADADKDNPMINGLAYRCTWMPGRADEILGAVIEEFNRDHQVQAGDRSPEAYAGELFACGIPDSWRHKKAADFRLERDLKVEILEAAFADPDAHVEAHQ